jgi:cytochrome c oxidase assembly factor 6
MQAVHGTDAAWLHSLQPFLAGVADHDLLQYFMGWFSRPKPEQHAVASRQERSKCWESRDAYFACLDGVGVVRAGEEGKACSTQAVQYDENCAKSWVCHDAFNTPLRSFFVPMLKIEYFNQRRVIADRQKDRLASGTQAEVST